MKNAKGLSKNPLGIIALFISMIYGFACLVLGVSLNNLNTLCERLPLIWFIIIFPLFMLGTFIFLVVKHHEKLYAPSEYRYERNFFGSPSNKEVPSDLDNLIVYVESTEIDTIQKKEIIEEIKKVKEKSKTIPIPINNLWNLNHWGSNCASIIDNKMVFTGTSAPEGKDGSHINLFNILENGKTYEISCFAKSDIGTEAKFQLWCHDQKDPNSSRTTVATDYKIPSYNGEKFSLNFKAEYNNDIRIHLQYLPGKGRIEVRDVRISELKA
ncbi:MAG: hypothetical protein A2475_14210 [Ignavibacteria bacterium RIFOXYC2_FULL_35_21]|nr:MAG: hypothetical protein A2220_16105 [Ignavibacteria bacterium RIFOXYA2_FULL_35_10]OGV24763.1 MAG: hypothetical protein A2475_14210 [Ignavibacteria bacterium RIFOXYC2_FULL_35_21]